MPRKTSQHREGTGQSRKQPLRPERNAIEVAGLEHGLARLNDGVPIGCRGSRQGEFRRSQNWIGGTRAGNAHFEPPPPGHLEDCMTQLEPFIHGGRLGRLLIVLLLIEAGVLQQPFLYMSLFFKQHGSRYYELLDRLRQQENWEAWLAWGLAQAAAYQHQAAALNGIELSRSVYAGIFTNHSDRTHRPTAPSFERPRPNGSSGKTKTGGPEAR